MTTDIQLRKERIERYLSNFAFFDVEASGLHAGSFPIEFGWATCDLKQESFLIKPSSDWTLASWSRQSESIHNISWAMLEESGLDLDTAYRTLMDDVGSRSLVSDAPSYDENWLRTFFDSACKSGMPPIVSLEEIIYKVASLCDLGLAIAIDRMGDTEHVYPHPHRAGADALQMAAQIRSIYDDEFYIEILDKSWP